jgi:putative DNA primase/helicase
VIICEGEKAVDAATLIFPCSVVVTSCGGASAATKTDGAPLAGKRVLLWPDCDDAGTKYARQVATILSAIGCDVSIIDAMSLAAICPTGSDKRIPVAGWDAADAVDEWEDASALRRAANGLAKPFDPGPRYISHGAFTMSADGLTVEVMRGRGNAQQIVQEPVSSPFEILGKSRNSGGHDWGLWLRWHDGDGRVHERLVASAALHGEPALLCQSLAADGLRIVREKQRALAGYLCGADVRGRVTKADRTGWHTVAGRDIFVLPSETIGPRGCETIVLDGAANAPYEARGTLAAWQAGVGALAQGHGLPVLAISAALAGPLLYLAGGEGGGIHFFGQSSKGKTTILQAAASVWGRGSTPGFVKAWRATANGLEGAASLHSDTALILDEMGVLDARDAAASIYSLANGGGKQRAGRDGSLREPKSWRVIVVSSGEVPLEAKLSEGKGKARAGQLIRILDLPADRGLSLGVFDHGGDKGDPGALSRAIKNAAVAAYGTAGPEFIRKLVAKNVTGDDVRSIVDKFVKDVCPPGADSQCERAAQRLGLVLAAGELAITLGIVPWQTGEARDAAAWAFDQWFANRGGDEPAEERQAVEQVRLFMEQHGDSRFDALDKPDGRAVNNRAGWRKGEGDAREWLIPPATWNGEICVGLEPTFVAATLCDRGMLKRVGDGFLSVRPIAGKSKRVYVVTSRIFAGDDDDAGIGRAPASCVARGFYPERRRSWRSRRSGRSPLRPETPASTPVTPATCR